MALHRGSDLQDGCPNQYIAGLSLRMLRAANDKPDTTKLAQQLEQDLAFLSSVPPTVSHLLTPMHGALTDVMCSLNRVIL